MKPGGRRGLRALLGATVALVLLVGAVPTHAAGPWTPRGPAARDPEQQEPRPRGFVDVPGPVVVEPQGELRVATTDRTNIVLLVVDDLAEMDERVWERLPTIRRLFLERGVRFTNAFVNDPLCCPGRAGLLTGLTTDHHGVWTNQATLFDPRVSLATELRGAGYFTFMAGKYLNGGWPTDPTPPGWDRLAFTGNAYYGYSEWVDGERLYHDDDANDYQPDVAFNRALQSLRSAPRGKPVFAYLTPYSVHKGRDPFLPGDPKGRPAVAQRFRGSPACADIPPWDTPAHADDNSDRPLYQQAWTRNNPEDLRAVCESLLAVDDGMRRVIRELRLQGRYRDTLFVLTSDNGMGFGAHGQRAKTVSFATPVPLYMTWIAGRGGERSDEPSFVSNIDIAPTLCAVGGCRMGPFPGGPSRADGVSLVPLIDGTATLRRRVIYVEHLTGVLWRGIRTAPDHPLGAWTYTRYSTDERELYDLSGGPCVTWQVGDAGDPCELTNLAGLPEHAAVQAGLEAILDAAVATGGHAPSLRGRMVERR